MKKALILSLFIIAGGCTAQKTAEVKGWLDAPITHEIAKTVPFGDVILGLIGAGLTAWGAIQTRKTANRNAIIKGAKAAIDAAPETVKAQVKATHGVKLSALAKSITNS